MTSRAADGRAGATRRLAASGLIALALGWMPGCGEGDPPADPAAAEARPGGGASPARRSADAAAVDEALGRLQQQYLQLEQRDADLGGVLVRVHEFVAAHPDHADARLLLGQVLLSAGRVEPAYQQIDRATDLAPDRAAWHELAGTLAAKMRRYDEAESHYRRAIELKPGDAKPRLLLAGVTAEQDRYEQAEALLTEALEIDASLHRAHHTLAGVALERGRFVEARTHARRAIELVRGGDASAQRARRIYKLMLSRVLRAENRPADALDVLRSVEPLAQRTHDTVLEAEAEIHAELGRPEAAARVYERLIVVRPTDLDLHERAAKWHLEAGNLDAVRSLERHAREVNPAAPQTRRIREMLEAATG